MCELRGVHDFRVWVDVVGGEVRRGIWIVDVIHMVADAEGACEVGKFVFNDSYKVVEVLSSKFGKMVGSKCVVWEGESCSWEW